ncbi:MAG: Gfo/Idh/MocA family oxidoreductase [Planctomycetota bacterium]
MINKKVSLAVIGAGGRGLRAYGQYVQEHHRDAQIVAVAEPRDFYRSETAKLHNIPEKNIFTSWEHLLSCPKLADAVIISTPDRLHKDPAIAAAEKGYHILLEKPMSPTAKDCIEIVEAAKKNNVILAVCHVMRYTPFYKKVKEIIDSGKLGEIACIQHLEGVAWWHYVHSYVRGEWRNTQESSFMLLAKSCHDIDMIRWYLDGKRCLRVASFGHLKHFRKEHKPAQAASRCMNCPLADDDCPYSAKKFYFGRLRGGNTGWPLPKVIHEFTEDALEKALREGPWGRCVYECDNDVVDHQVVSMEFEDKITADFTMTTFTPYGRRIRLMGTKGYLEGDEQIIKVLDFVTEKWFKYEVNKSPLDITGGHGGGDQGLMEAFIEAIRHEDTEDIKTGPDETLESHLIVFAAERARLEGRVVSLDEMYKYV